VLLLKAASGFLPFDAGLLTAALTGTASKYVGQWLKAIASCIPDIVKERISCV